MKKYNIYVITGLFSVAVIFGFLATSKKDEVKSTVVHVAITYLDVRTDEEWESGHVNGAIHFDLAKLQKGELPQISKDAEISVYCRSGKRASEAVRILTENNFTHVNNVGGFSGLETQGKKVCYGITPDCG